MTPADLIRPCLLEADRRKPELRIDNRFQSCFELLELALALCGTNWHFIGKSSKKGEAGFRPSWWRPQFIPCRRPDGQSEEVMIDLLGMDAAWHLPSARQVKVIANSTANEPGDHVHGPANLTPYEIEPAHYRWHNPPIAQSLVVIPPMPGPQPPPPPQPTTGLLSKADAFQRLTQLNAFYEAQDGLQRPGGMFIDGHVDLEAVAQWFYQMVIEGVSWESVRAQLRGSREWRTKHPGELP